MGESSKVTWILLRGWTRENRHWREFPEHLSQTTGGKVVAIDLPGAGTECLRGSPLSIREITEDVRKRFQPDPHSRAIAVGISMGGMVALDWALTYPKDFAGIVLINSSLANLSKVWERLNLKSLPRIIHLMAIKNLEEVESGILGLTSSLPEETRLKIAKEFAIIAKESPVHKVTLLRQLAAAATFSPRSMPELPSLVLSSKKDGLVNPICSEKLARALKTSVIVHPSAGHDLSLDDPQWLSSKMARWLTSSFD